MNEIILNSDTHDVVQAVRRIERAVPYPDVALLVSLDIPSFGKVEALSSRAGLLALQVREDLNWDFMYLYNFPNISSARILIIIFTQMFSKSRL